MQTSGFARGGAGAAASPARRGLRRRSLLILLAAAGGCGPAAKPPAVPLTAESAPAAAVPPLERPAPRPADFVGSAACASCHEKIAESFARSPMGMSLAEVGREEPLETYPGGPVVDGGREYSAERIAPPPGGRGPTVVHREILRDASGEVLSDQAERVRFVLGSGELGRSYLIEHGGRLYQSPLGWYAGRDRWDLSPGYRGTGSPRFERAIGDGCLACHAGRMEPMAAADPGRPIGGRYAAETIFAEEAIGCERCHGPGGRHVAAMEAVAAGGEKGDPCIVNPAALDPARREDVCNQCHLGGEALLPRFGRSLFDFRPGDRLDDTRVVLVRDPARRVGPDQRPVSHVEQMRASRCFLASDGRLGCTSCHDPHAASPPPAEAAAFHAAKCNACHDTAGCPLPAAERDLPPAVGSCIHCHMPRQAAEGVPHTALTDHTIPRRAAPPATAVAKPAARPPSREGLLAAGDAATTVVPFAGAAERLPPRELARGLGLHLADAALATRDPAAAARAEALLVPLPGGGPVSPEAIDAVGDDLESLSALAALAAATGRMEIAAACQRRVLAIDPEDEQALAFLAGAAGREGRFPESLALANRLVAAHPAVSAHHRLRAQVLAAAGRRDEWAVAVRDALARDPSQPDVRRWLAEGLARDGRGDEAATEQARAGRIEAALGRGKGAARGRPGQRSSTTVSD